MKRIVVAIYIDPDFFPPTINAILNLAEVAEEVVVISRNNSVKNFPYPNNVTLKKIGKRVSVRESEKQAAWLKVWNFLKFASTVRRYSKSKKTSLVMLYDPIALFAFFLMNRGGGKSITWYHNHDMPNREALSKYSIGGLAAKYEKRAMRKINFFSLPSEERLRYYPNVQAAVKVFVIPNYPSLKVYLYGNRNKSLPQRVNLIYQGFIGKGHGLEEIILLLRDKVNGFQLQLILKGSVTKEYKSHLNAVATQQGVTDQITWIGIGPYSEIPAITASAHIGIGINENTDIVSKTQGTASNKIYEYAASGLPVLLDNSEQFTKVLAKYKWTFFTETDSSSIKKVIMEITTNWQEFSTCARTDFEQRLNFEKEFVPVLETVLSSHKNGNL